MVLMQNCKMANATSNSTAVVLTENDFPRAALERRNPAKLRRRSLSSLDLVVWTPLRIQCISLAGICSTKFVISKLCLKFERFMIKINDSRFKVKKKNILQCILICK